MNSPGALPDHIQALTGAQAQSSRPVIVLATSGATAAKEIKDLLTDSAAKVDLGTQQVGIAGGNTDEIIRAARSSQPSCAQVQACRTTEESLRARYRL